MVDSSLSLQRLAALSRGQRLQFCIGFSGAPFPACSQAWLSLILKEQGIELIAADKPDAFLDDTPTAILIRQVLGAVSQFEKAMVVTKLKGARDRKRIALAQAAKEDKTIRVKVEGRKSYSEISPDMVRLAKRLHRYPVDGKRRSLQDVSSALAQAGHVTRTGKPFTAEAISRMVKG